MGSWAMGVCRACRRCRVASRTCRASTSPAYRAAPSTALPSPVRSSDSPPDFKRTTRHDAHDSHDNDTTNDTTHRIRRCVHVGVELQRPAGLRLQGRIPAAIAQTAAPHQGTLPPLPLFSFSPSTTSFATSADSYRFTAHASMEWVTMEWTTMTTTTGVATKASGVGGHGRHFLRRPHAVR